MTSVKKYIESNKDRFIEELFSLIRIPSISAKHEHKPDMEACANAGQNSCLQPVPIKRL